MNRVRKTGERAADVALRRTIEAVEKLNEYIDGIDEMLDLFCCRNARLNEIVSLLANLRNKIVSCKCELVDKGIEVISNY
ncbi:MAG: hypothetical protein FWE01_01110 [Firmicutes bacterium]|nr:hypothetical protein [Bacillota bacterium]